jgi:predicted nucleic acid-binding protein
MPVVDTSVVVDWVAPDADPAGPARRLLSRLAADATEVFGPRLLLEEVANALLTGVRRGRWSGAEADAASRCLRRLPARLVDACGDLDRAWELSRRYDHHPVYDMGYVALADDETHLKCSRSGARASRENCSRNLGPASGAAVCLGDGSTVVDGDTS